MINLFSKTDDFIKMIDLFTKTSLGRSGHARNKTFYQMSHVSGLDKGLHRATGIPRKPWENLYFNLFLGYFWNCGLNIKVFGQNNLIFELLQQK